jgi:O-methyltransferase involved in polyketide biosynthesis
MTKIKVELGDVQITMLMPLIGRAVMTRKNSRLINDPRAVEIVDSLDYDFSKWEKSKSLVGATLRTRMFDDFVQEFLRQHPTGTIIEIGCGLNTRFERLDNGQAYWIECDLPDSIALRRKFFQDNERRQMIVADVMQTNWFEQVKAINGPYCFISESVLIYLDNADAEQAIRQIAAAFPGAWFLTDTTAQSLVDNQGKQELTRQLPPQSWFRWVCDEPKSLEKLGLKLIASHSLLDASPELVSQLPFLMRLFYKLAPGVLRRISAGFYINRFEVVKP